MADFSKHTVITKLNTSEIEIPTISGEEVWLEYGFTTDNSQGAQNMLWYNDGNVEEIGHWTRKLCQKILTNEPSGEMYFAMRARDVEHKIIVGD